MRGDNPNGLFLLPHLPHFSTSDEVEAFQNLLHKFKILYESGVMPMLSILSPLIACYSSGALEGSNHDMTVFLDHLLFNGHDEFSVEGNVYEDEVHNRLAAMEVLCVGLGGACVSAEQMRRLHDFCMRAEPCHCLTAAGISQNLHLLMDSDDEFSTLFGRLELLQSYNVKTGIHMVLRYLKRFHKAFPDKSVDEKWTFIERYLRQNGFHQTIQMMCFIDEAKTKNPRDKNEQERDVDAYYQHYLEGVETRTPLLMGQNTSVNLRFHTQKIIGEFYMLVILFREWSLIQEALQHPLATHRVGFKQQLEWHEHWAKFDDDIHEQVKAIFHKVRECLYWAALVEMSDLDYGPEEIEAALSRRFFTQPSVTVMDPEVTSIEEARAMCLARAKVFDSPFYDGESGGQLWRVIALSAAKLWEKESYTTQQMMGLIDHAIDLSHNSGLIFSKVFWEEDGEEWNDGLKLMLSEKRVAGSPQDIVKIFSRVLNPEQVRHYLHQLNSLQELRAKIEASLG